MTQSRFAHRRRDAYNVALRLLADVENLADGFPRGHANLRDQTRRAVAAMLTGLARRERRRAKRSEEA